MQLGDQIRFTPTGFGGEIAKDRPREAPKTPLSVVGTVIHINRAHRHCTLEYQVFGTTMRESFKI